MKTFTRKELPENIVYNNRTYTFHSAIDREGLEAQQRGEHVVKVRIDNDKRRESRRMFRFTNGKVRLMKYHNPTDYYYTVKK